MWLLDDSADRAEADELIARLQRGERLGETEKRHLSLGSRLRVQRAEREILDRMTPQQRMLGCREGRLSAYQRNHRSASTPARCR